jgi:hypothetical protein
MALYWPQGWEKDAIKFGRPICNPKVLKVGPKFFWVLTPSVKRALNAIQTTNSLVTFFFLLLHLGTKPVMLYYYN